MIKRATFSSFGILLLSFALPVFAQDPPVDPPKPDPIPPAPVVVTITAPKDVTGTGTREDPFVFTSKTKCLLTLSTDIKPEDWDIADAPSDIEPIGSRSLVFSLAKSGSFQAIAKTPYARCWFMIKTTTDPPTPPSPPTPASISQKVAAALTGPNAQSDAIILIAAAEKVVSSIDTYKTAAELQQHWFALLKANNWVKGSRPAITAILEVEIPPDPPGTTSPLLTPAERVRLASIFTAIADGSKQVIK